MPTLIPTIELKAAKEAVTHVYDEMLLAILHCNPGEECSELIANLCEKYLDEFQTVKQLEKELCQGQ